MARGAGCSIAVAALLLAVPAATAEQTASQRFFTEQLLEDPRTSDQIAELLRAGGFVDPRIRFADLNGDDRDDAVVRVHSGGAAGIVAVYVFSTAGADDLRVVFRSQSLTRASTRVRKKRRVSYRYARYEPADALCCPSRTVEATLRWQGRKSRFVVARRDQVDPPPEPARRR